MKIRIKYKNGEPCYHSGCKYHTLHPCEICGRYLAQGETVIYKEMSQKEAKIFLKRKEQKMNKIEVLKGQLKNWLDKEDNESAKMILETVIAMIEEINS